jgi:phenylalanyl-tRNA synthetase beta chain
MKISIEWLRDYVRLPEDLARLRADLSMIGLVVEAVAGEEAAPIFEVEVTSNRPDCLSYLGIAREIAALYGSRLKKRPAAKALRAETESIPYAIEIRDPDLCPRYVGLVLDGIRVAQSPAWMQRRLEASGMRAVNNVVDITNYVLLEHGHPLHAFDFDQLHGGKIIVARARAGQRMLTLDGVERELDEEMLLINDGAGPVAIAGVMGGLNSEIGTETARVLLECAYFKPASVRRTSKKLGLSTEASYRFERGADWEGTVPAIARTCELICQIAGGRIVGSIQDIYPNPIAPVEIDLARAHAEALLGVRLKPAQLETTLKRLNFGIKRTGRGVWRVQCPTYRADMELEADLIEEIARFYGYQNIPTTVPAGRSPGEPAPAHQHEREARRILLGLEYSECVNLSFASAEDQRQFPPEEGQLLRIKNPLTEDTELMRGHIAPGLVRAARHNFNYGQHQIRLFEIGKVFQRSADGTLVERDALGILGTGNLTAPSWIDGTREYGLYHLKGAVTALLGSLRSAPAEIIASAAVPWLEGASAASIVLGGRRLGWMGRLHPDLEEEYKFRQPIFVAEIDFQGLVPHLFSPAKFDPLPRFPSVERDISMVLPKSVAYGELQQGILGLHIKELAGLDLVDIYEGEPIAAGRASVTLRLTFLDREGTLTVDRVQSFSDNIRAYLRDTFGAENR